MDPTLSFGAIGALFGSAAFFVGILTAGITFAWPLRPSWLPWLASMLLGPLLTFGLAKASGLTLTEAMYYQCLFVGLMAGASAGGYNQMTRKGDELRSEQQKQAYGTVEKPAEAAPVAPVETPPPPPPSRVPPEARHGSAGPAVPYVRDPEAEPFEGVNHGIKIDPMAYPGENSRDTEPQPPYPGNERRQGSRAPGTVIRRRPSEENPE